MQVKSIAECSKWSILQHFPLSLSYHLSLRSLFCLFLSGSLRQVLLYIFKRIVGKPNFRDQFKKIIKRYKKVGYNLDVMPQSACLVVNPITGAQWLSGRVLDLRLKGRGFEPHRRHCVVVLEQDTFILA